MGKQTNVHTPDSHVEDEVAQSNTLFRQISNLLIENGVNLDEFKQPCSDVSESKLTVLDEEKEDMDEHKLKTMQVYASESEEDEGLLDETMDSNGEVEDVEWNLKAMQLLAQHEQKQLNQAQIDRARKLLAAKRAARGRVRMSVLNRRDLLKLNKQKIARKCNQAGIDSYGTKQEMVDRLIEKNKKKTKHKKTTEHVFQ